MNENESLVAIRLARGAIESELLDKSIPSVELLPDVFKEVGAVFVTLKNRPDNSLRGCIGSLIAHRLLYEDIVANAISSAFNDPRFPSLDKNELANIKIEISILSAPKKLVYKDAADLLSKITPKVDGLIVKYQEYQATFLPSVWDEVPLKEQFLSLLCKKAGLDSDFYKKGDLEVYTYQAEKFEEA
jgi:uncharacterized protein